MTLSFITKSIKGVLTMKKTVITIISIQEKEVFLMDKKQTITTERKIGKITYLVQALPSEKATDTIHKKIEKLIVKDLQKKPGNPGFLASE